jgi:hypothetical protein
VNMLTLKTTKLGGRSLFHGYLNATLLHGDVIFVNVLNGLSHLTNTSSQSSQIRIIQKKTL